MSKADELKAKNENLFERNTILLNENERLKKEIAELKSIAEFQQSSNMKRYFEIQELKKENAELEQQIEQIKSDVIECFGSEYNVLVEKLLNKWGDKRK